MMTYCIKQQNDTYIYYAISYVKKLLCPLLLKVNCMFFQMKHGMNQFISKVSHKKKCCVVYLASLLPTKHHTDYFCHVTVF